MKILFRSLLGTALALFLAAAAHAQVLTISSVAVDNAAPKPGDSVTYTITVLNTDPLNPSVSGTGNFDILLLNQNTGQTINLVTTAVTVPVVAGGASVDIKISKIVPISTSQAGPCKVSVTMTGVGVFTFTTSSAIVTIVGKPDLAITSLTYPAGTAYKGGDVIPMQLTWTNRVSSTGGNCVPYVPSANGDGSFFRIEIILSSNPTFGDSDDFLLTSYDIGTVQNADGLNRTLNWNQLLPGNFAGSYYVMAKIDVATDPNVPNGNVSEAIDNDLAINGNNTWFNETNAARINLLPTNFPTDYWASTGSNGYSDNPALSSDGRYVAFASDATNLVTASSPGGADTNGVRDIFLYDNQTATVRRLNLSQQGAQANGASNNPAISATGRYVAFASDATNLVLPGPNFSGDNNGFSDIFVVDSVTGAISLVSVTTGGVQANGSNFKPSISADGRYVVYQSSATNLVTPNTAVGVTHIYLRNRNVGGLVDANGNPIYDVAGNTDTTLVDVSTTNAVANGNSLEASISANGQYVVFSSDATNLVAGDTNTVRDIFLRDLVGGTTIRVSVPNLADQGTLGTQGNGASRAPSVSSDGSYIAFGSEASNLVLGDTNGVSDIFVYNRATAAVTRVSVSSAGSQATDPSAVGFRLGSVNPSISSTGRYVTFASLANNLAVGDAGGQTQNLIVTAGGAGYGAAPGVTLVGGGGTGATATATISGGAVVSVTVTNPGSGYTSAPTVVFASGAAAATAFANPNGFVTGPDANNAVDVFVIDRDVNASGTYDTPGNIATSVMSVNRFGYQTQQLLGTPSSAASDIYPVISADGRWVALPTDAENTAGLIHGATNRTSPDSNTYRDVILHDRRTNTLPNAGISPTVSIAASSPPLVNTDLTLSSTATTTIGVIQSVQFYVNGTLLSTSTTFPYTATWHPTAVGTYSLSALATDIFGNIGVSSNLSVTVYAQPDVRINSPLTGTTLTYPPGAPTIITATATPTTPNTQIGSVQFKVNGSYVGAPIPYPGPYTYAWTPPSVGTFALTAVATDNNTSNESAAQTVTVSTGAATPPTFTSLTVSGGLSPVVNLPQTLTAVFTPTTGAAITSVQFFANNIPLATATGSPYTVTWTPLNPGTYALVAKATDSNGSVTTSPVQTVTVTAGVGPTVTLANPGSPWAANSVVTLTATATPGGAAIKQVQFFDNGVVIGTVLAPPYTVSWNPVMLGGHTLVARATDNVGNFADNSPAVSVLVDQNQAPTIASAPISGNGATSSVGVANTISAPTATDPDGTVASVQFFASYNGGAPASLGTATIAPYNFSWTPRIAGTYALTAVATDNLGATSATSPTTTVTVSGGNAPTGVVVTAPAQLAVNSAGTLSATATPATGTIASVQFFANNVSLGTTTTFPYRATWTPTANGTYAITALATDTAGNQTLSTAVPVLVAANQAPTVNITTPVNPSIAGVGSVNTVTATATDPDGSVASVQFFVALGSGTPVSLGTVNASPYTTSWIPRIAGTYALTAVATDNLGTTTTSATTTVTVSGGNAPTGVVVAAPAQLAVNSSTTLTATATAVTGTIASVQFFANNVSLGTTTTFPYRATWTPSAIGTYAITALATDTAGNQTLSATATTTVAVNQSPVITAPLSALGATPGVGVANTISVASATDPDGTVASVQFFANGISLGTATTAPYSVSWTTRTANTYNLTAVATDNLGATMTSATTIVTVAGGNAPAVAITSPAPGTIAVNTAQTVTATATAVTGTIASVQFFANGAPLGTITAFPYRVSWTPIVAGSYVLTAVATDTAGNQTTSAVVAIIVTSGGAPTVTLTAPVNGSSVAVNSAQTLTATASAVTGTIASVQFFVNGVSLGTVTVFPYRIGWTPVTNGSYAITALATDSLGNQATSSASTVTVAANQPPTVAAPVSANGAASGVGVANTISAPSATDPDGTVANVQIFASYNGGAPVSLGTATTAPYSVAWTPRIGGTYGLTAVATDNLGATSATSPVTTVIVAGGNAPTGVVVTAPTQLAVNSSGTLSATATAATGTISSVQFFANGVSLGTDTTFPYTATFAPTANGTYLLTALATDTAGNQTLSAAVSVTVGVNAAPTVSITAPANLATVGVGSVNAINATAADSDGTVSSVQFFAALGGGTPISLGTVNTPPYTTAWTPRIAGAYQLTAVATDNLGATTTSGTINVTVAGGNAPTGVVVTAPAQLAVNSSTTVSATATAVTGTIASVQFFANGVSLGSDTTFPYTATFAPTANGTYAITALATDTAGNQTLSPTVSVTVAANQSPTVGAPTSSLGATPGVGVTNTLGALTATDPDGTVASVQFFANGVSLGTVTAAPFTLAWTPAIAGTYNLTVQVTDNLGAKTTSAITTVTVSGGNAPLVTVTAPTAGSTVVANSFQTVTATATAVTGTIASIQFFDNGVSLGTDNQFPYAASWSPAATGSHSLTALATDTLGNQAVAVSTVTVSPGTAATVTITNPAGGANLAVNVAQPIETSVIVGSLAISGVEFFANTVSLGIITQYPYTLSWTPTNIGNYALTAVVTDTIGNKSPSPAVNVTVATATGGTVVNAISNNGNTALPQGSSVMLQAVPSVSQGVIRQIQFFEDGVALGAPVTSAPFTLLYRPQTAAGTTHAMTAQATNSNGVALAVSAPLTISVVSRVPAAPAVVPTTVAITAPLDAQRIAVPTGSNTITVSVNASTTGGFVNKVELYIEGALFGSSTAYPYNFAWAPTKTGTYHLVALAYDNFNNIVASVASAVVPAAPAATTVIVAPPPVIAITSPLDGGTLTGGSQAQVTFNASTTNGYPLDIQLFQDGNYVGGTSMSAGGIGSISYVPTQKTHVVNGATVVDASTLYAIATDQLGFATKSVVIANLNVTNGGTSTGTTVIGLPPIVTVTSPTASSIFPVNAPVTLTADASDPDGNVVSVTFAVNGQIVNTLNAYPYTLIWTPKNLGLYAITAKATDNDGNTVTSTAVTVSVVDPSPGNPTATITSPVNGASLTAGTNVSIAASATAGLSVASVQFYVNGQPLGAPVTSSPFNISWTPATPGTYALVARATDSICKQGTSATVTVTVSSGISLIAGTTLVPQGSSVVVKADPNAGQGTIKQVQFFDNTGAGPIAFGSPVTNAPFTLVYTPATAVGTTHVISAQATNNNGVALAMSSGLTLTVVGAIAPLPTVAIGNPLDAAKIAIPTGSNSIAVSVNTTLAAGFITKVELYIEGSLFSTGSVYPYAFAWTPTVTGTYHLVALAYDNHGNLVASPTTTVIVAAPPVVAITSPLAGGTLTGGAQAQVTFTASTGNGYPLDIQLFQDGNYVGGTSLASPGGVGSISFVPTQKTHRDVAGNTIVDLSTLYVIATDPLGFATKSVEVGNLNVTNGGTSTGTTVIGQPPIVSVTSPTASSIFPVNAPVTLTANASDPDGNVVSVVFLVNNQVVSTLNAYPYTFVWTPKNLGLYAITAKATDNDGNTVTSAAVTVSVIDPTAGVLPTATITSPANGSSLTAGTVVPIAASATAGQNVANVQIYLNGQPLGAPITTTPFNTSWTPATPGTYTLIARATDNIGNQGTSSTVTVTVIPNAPPTVTLTSPTATTIVAGTAVALAASASDKDGTVSSVSFIANSITIATLTSAPYTTTWTPGGAGSYTLVAQATDNSGNVTNSTPVVLTVVANQPPTVAITAPVTGRTVNVSSSVSITATASDVDGVVASVQFFANGISLGTVTSAPYQTTWSPTAEGAYRLTAVATDNAGATTTSAAVTVLAVILSSANSDTVYTGFYAALGESGGFAAINLHGRTATLIGYVPSTQTLSPAKTYYYADVPIDASGGFTLRNTSGTVLISGAFSATGVNGTFDGGRVTFIGPSTSAGVTSVAAGYYSGSILGHSASVLTGLVGLDGTITLYLADGTFVDSGAGAVDATGAFTITTRAGNKFTGKADPATGFLSGTLSGAASGTFAAALPSGNTFSDGFLRNISTRGLAGTGNNILIAGFVVNGTVPKQILIRAIGPTLAQAPYSLTGVLPDPQVQLFNSAGAPVVGGYNNDWGSIAGLGTVFAQVGAFALPVGSKDSAVLLTLSPGLYTAQVSDVTGATGLALVELYDVDNQAAFSTQKMVNISTRGQVGTGSNILIAGFVVNGTSPKKVLVRGLGPTLATYGVTGVLADPILRIVRPSDGLVIRENDNWEVGNDATLVTDAATRVGAIPLTSGSKDAVILMTLPPGVYTAQLSGVNSGTGIGLIEVYEVP